MSRSRQISHCPSTWIMTDYFYMGHDAYGIGLSVTSHPNLGGYLRRWWIIGYRSAERRANEKKSPNYLCLTMEEEDKAYQEGADAYDSYLKTKQCQSSPYSIADEKSKDSLKAQHWSIGFQDRPLHLGKSNFKVLGTPMEVIHIKEGDYYAISKPDSVRIHS